MEWTKPYNRCPHLQAKVKELHAKGKSIWEIAEEVGVSYGTVRAVVMWGDKTGWADPSEKKRRNKPVLYPGEYEIKDQFKDEMVNSKVDTSYWGKEKIENYLQEKYGNISNRTYTEDLYNDYK